MNKLKKIIRIIQIASLKRKANKLAKTTCRQHFVVIFGGQIRIIDEIIFKNLRQKGVFDPNYTRQELKQIALYYTKNRKELNGLKTKRQ